MEQTTTGATHPQAVTDADFAAVVEGASELVLVDFGAAWCGPCRMMEPTVEALAGEYAGRVKVVTVDSDANQQTVARYNVRSLPTFMFFKGGKPVDQVIGAVPRPMLERKIEEHV
jgi:thioredoxin 1